MKVYICGSKQDRKKFKIKEKELKQQGHIPINPLRVIYSLPEEINNADFTIIAFELIRISDSICVLDGWENDMMARLEMAHAKRNEKEILN